MSVWLDVGGRFERPRRLTFAGPDARGTALSAEPRCHLCRQLQPRRRFSRGENSTHDLRTDSQESGSEQGNDKGRRQAEMVVGGRQDVLAARESPRTSAVCAHLAPCNRFF